jgi:hypothetical protein
MTPSNPNPYEPPETTSPSATAAPGSWEKIKLEALLSAVPKVAADIYGALSQPAPERIQVDPANAMRDYAALNIPFYAKQTEALREVGFSFIADYEITNLQGTSNMRRTFIRVLSDVSDAIAVGIYFVRPKFPGLFNWLMSAKMRQLARGRGTVEFCTEFSDGVTLMTNNQGEENPFTEPPEVSSERMSAETDATQLLARHRERVRVYETENPGDTRIAIRSLQDVAEMEMRHWEAKRRYRRRIGNVTDGELRGLLREHYDALAEPVRAELNRLLILRPLA